MSQEVKNRYEADIPEIMPLYRVSASEILIDAAQNVASNARDFGRKYYKEGVSLASILAIAGACGAGTPEPTPTEAAPPTKAPTAISTLEPKALPILSPTSEPPPTATATQTFTPEPPTPAPTETSTPTPEPSPTPEFEFEPYGVYVGEFETGGKVLLVTLPNGKFAFQPFKPEVVCSDGEFSIYKSIKGGDYRDGSFDYVNRSKEIFIEGSLTNHSRVEGRMWNKNLTLVSASGDIKCEANSFNFTAKLVGTGKDVLLEGYREVVPDIPDEFAIKNIEVVCECKLPED